MLGQRVEAVLQRGPGLPFKQVAKLDNVRSPTWDFKALKGSWRAAENLAPCGWIGVPGESQDTIDESAALVAEETPE